MFHQASLRLFLRGSVALALLAVSACRSDSGRRIEILSSSNGPRAAFAVEHIADALRGRGYAVTFPERPGTPAGELPPSNPDSVLERRADDEGEIDGRSLHTITLSSGATSGDPRQSAGIEGLETEGFRIDSDVGSGAWRVTAADQGGLMYGGLELAEQIAVNGLTGVEPIERNPYMEMRGVKFNIPLDVRTPSYTDMSDAGQKNMAVVWDLGFWEDFLDRLAEHRYNFVSLWSLHPFPSMIRVPEYPDVALDDVKRSTAQFDEYYPTQGLGMDAAGILESVETVVSMTMDDKIAFWNRVMEYAAGRNIRFYVVTWNIFVNGTDGKYGITDAIDNPVTIDYFRKSVRAMFTAYPLLAGIGLTTGENMPGASFAEKEDWAYRTYGMGVIDAARDFPDRQITFIHRQHQAGATAIAERFAPLIEQPNVDMIFSFKYAQAHVYSSTTQNFHRAFVDDIGGMQTIWTLRNDDVYQFRWGAPDFVREFIRNIPYEVSRGYYFGSDQWIWGREFLSLYPEFPRDLEIDKHWYQWLLWGRLGFDPSLDNARLTAILRHKFPNAPAGLLLEAWQEASMVYPVVTGFHWGEFDFQWYIEACKSRPEPARTESGFHDVNRFITLGPHPGTDYVSIPDYVAIVREGRDIEGTPPPEISDRLNGRSDRALSLLDSFEAGGDAGLEATLHDIRTIALMGKYYAHKIRGATELALFRASDDEAYRRSAVEALTEAAAWWGRYTEAARARYANPFWTNRVGHVDWDAVTVEVERDIEIASRESS